MFFAFNYAFQMFWAVFFMLGIRLCCFYIQPLDSTKKWWPLLHTIEMFALLIMTLHWSICSGPLDLGLQKQNSGLSHYIFSILVMWWFWLNMPMQWQQHLNRLLAVFQNSWCMLGLEVHVHLKGGYHIFCCMRIWYESSYCCLSYLHYGSLKWHETFSIYVHKITVVCWTLWSLLE